MSVHSARTRWFGVRRSGPGLRAAMAVTLVAAVLQPSVSAGQGLAAGPGGVPGQSPDPGSEVRLVFPDSRAGQMWQVFGDAARPSGMVPEAQGPPRSIRMERTGSSGEGIILRTMGVVDEVQATPRGGRLAIRTGNSGQFGPCDGPTDKTLCAVLRGAGTAILVGGFIAGLIGLVTR